MRLDSNGNATLLKNIIRYAEYDGRFGSSLAHDGVHLYVGASGVVAGGKTGAGAVFVFKRVATNWNHLDTLVRSRGAVIAHGHITEAWIERFPGEYGSVGAEAVPHFIAVFPASTEGDFVVADPMHRGGAVLMSQGDLQAFFKSPINEYETAIRVVTWDDSPGPNE